MSTDRMVNRFEKDEFYRIVGDTLRARRKDEGWTVSDLATAARLAESTIENAERGQSCSLLVLARLADAFDTTLDELVPVEALQ